MAQKFKLNIAKQAERIITIRDGKITSDIDNRKEQQGAENVKASDIGDVENGKTASLDEYVPSDDIPKETPVKDAEKEEFIQNLLADKEGKQ